MRVNVILMERRWESLWWFDTDRPHLPANMWNAQAGDKCFEVRTDEVMDMGRWRQPNGITLMDLIARNGRAGKMRTQNEILKTLEFVDA